MRVVQTPYINQVVKDARLPIASSKAMQWGKQTLEPGGSNRILWVTNIPAPYAVGVWRQLDLIADLEIFCHATTEDNRNWAVSTDGLKITFLNLKLLRLGYERKIYLGSFRVRLATLRSREAIFLDGWESLVALQILILAKLSRKPVVLSYWSTDHTHRHSRGPIALYRRIFMRSCDAVLTPGRCATEAAKKILAKSRTIVEEGNASVDIDRWELARKLRSASSTATDHTFLYVGQLVERKNVQLLIDGFNHVATMGDQLLVVGAGPENEKLRTHAGECKNIKFLGDLQDDDLLRAYASADTLVLPSLEEVWGLVTLEALAAGLHVVVSDVCGAAEDIKHFNSVFTFSTDNLASLVHALEASRKRWNGPIYENLRPDFEATQMAETINELAARLRP